MRKSKETLQVMLDKAVGENRIVSLLTHYLSDYGEQVLNQLTATILKKYDRMDLMDIVYTASKEVIINATKANIKRVIIRENGLHPENEEDYVKAIQMLKGELVEENVRKYRYDLKGEQLYVTATFYYNEDVLNIKVKNSFILLPQEEERIREKFRQSESFNSLIDFFMQHADDTEGAGLGLTMVGILLDQSGINRHSFTVYSNPRYNETAARLEIPLSKDYVLRRQRFEKEFPQSGKNIEEFRKEFSARKF
ncbi:MAG: hypothetical protein HY042_10635 [Spirochaetia bacterium]|nr:hypothetical protein [Spirochaetia bacterium]